MLTAVDSPKSGLWIIDAQGRTVYASAAMANILGTTPSEMLGQDSFSYVFPEDAEAAQRLFEAKKEGHMEAFHFKLRRKDGTAVLVDVQGTPMHKDNRQFVGIIGTFAISRSEEHTSE